MEMSIVFQEKNQPTWACINCLLATAPWRAWNVTTKPCPFERSKNVKIPHLSSESLVKSIVGCCLLPGCKFLLEARARRSLLSAYECMITVLCLRKELCIANPGLLALLLEIPAATVEPS